MADLADRVAENLARIREQIADAAQRSGRAANEVRLVGVTKYVGIEASRALIAAGLRDLGESRPQELWKKADAIQDQNVRWHLVGHLQRNKVRHTLPCAWMVHSSDSLRLLATVDQEAGQLGLVPRVLIEVNVSGETAKHGLQPDEVESLLPAVAAMRNLRVLGLMTMASLQGGRQQARRDFARLRELRDRLAALCPSEISLHELSMGMSEDFDIAIEEGATIVRVGSALFEGVAP
jgi:pyridoxal phosphate enzyme (YggS family)